MITEGFPAESTAENLLIYHLVRWSRGLAGYFGVQAACAVRGFDFFGSRICVSGREPIPGNVIAADQLAGYDGKKTSEQMITRDPRASGCRTT